MAWLPVFGRLRAAEPPGLADAELAGSLAAELDAAARARLGRSLGVFAVSAGGCGACALELRALRGTVYDLERLGLRFVGSPRQADVLLMTGPLTRVMAEPVAQAWAAMPGPKWAVALGACAIDGGPFAGSYAVLGGVGGAVPVSMSILGCPPAPASILAGLRTLIEANA